MLKARGSYSTFESFLTGFNSSPHLFFIVDADSRANSSQRKLTRT
jgi:hypothetical protein